MAAAAADPGPHPGDLTPWAARSSGTTRLLRGMRGRCPRCGGGGVRASFLEIADACPHCGWTFEREEGFWVGAMVVLFGAVEAVYLAFLAVGIVGWWPDVRWSLLLYVGLALNAVVPVLLYRWSKTTWMGLHSAFVPAELERDGARRSGV